MSFRVGWIRHQNPEQVGSLFIKKLMLSAPIGQEVLVLFRVRAFGSLLPVAVEFRPAISLVDDTTMGQPFAIDLDFPTEPVSSRIVSGLILKFLQLRPAFHIIPCQLQFVDSAKQRLLGDRTSRHTVPE